MKQKISSDFKLGILGGGQLGKMMIQAASKWDIEIHVLDPDESCSCSALCHQPLRVTRSMKLRKQLSVRKGTTCTIRYPRCL